MATKSDTTKTVYDAIAELTLVLGHSPTMREIADEAGLKSTASVYGHLRKLKAHGLVTWDKRQARTLRITARFPNNGLDSED